MGPYRFIEATSQCQVGVVWVAMDEHGERLTVAVLDTTVAADQGWRDAFAGTAHALTQPGAAGPRFVHADFSTASPWVAYPADGPGAEQLFAALGMPCEPVSTGSSGDAAPDEPTTVKIQFPKGSAAADGSAPAPSESDDEAEPVTTRFTPALDGTLEPTGPADLRQGPWPAITSSTDPVSAAPESTSAAPCPSPDVPPSVSAPPYPVSVPPHSVSAPPYPVSVPPHSVSAPPYPVSVPAQPGPEMPPADQVGPVAMADQSANDPLYSPVRHIVPSEPKPRRNRLWILVGALVLLLSAGGGTVVALTMTGADREPLATPTTSTVPPVVLPTSAPLQPGLEPPAPGTWPTQWPKFSSRDQVRTLTDLDGLGFPVKVPADWQCVLAARAEGFTKYNCGVPPGATPMYGGELVVRDCPQPCDERQQTVMRQAEEAWGQRWIRSGPFSSYAETNTLQENGERRHGLVVVAYFRSGSEGVIGRQLVFRMTGPVNGAPALRRVANYIRDAVIF